MQQERGAAGYIPSLREYSKTYTVNAKRFALAHETAILLDAGPVMRDLSIGSELVTHPRCKILDQVENGLAVRKALLWLLADRKDGKIKSFTPA
jgi:aspartate carbamoyltransferase catalytic subunit